MDTLPLFEVLMAYDDHPYAACFPLMPDLDLRALVDDIRLHGLRDPITIYQGKILDGRNRYRACVLAGAPVRVAPAPFPDDSAALDFVASMNVHRRHMTRDQLAFAGAKLANIRSGHNDNRFRSGSGIAIEIPLAERPEPITIAEAAVKLRIPKSAVDRARTVLNYAPDLESDILAGKLRMSTVAAQVRPSRKPQEPPPPPQTPPPLRIVPRPRDLTRPMVDSTFTGTNDDWSTKYGHVLIETAQERAVRRFAAVKRKLHIVAKAGRDNHLPDDLQGWIQSDRVDESWLVNVPLKDIDDMVASVETLEAIITRAKVLIQAARDGRVVKAPKSNGGG